MANEPTGTGFWDVINTGIGLIPQFFGPGAGGGGNGAIMPGGAPAGNGLGSLLNGGGNGACGTGSIMPRTSTSTRFPSRVDTMSTDASGNCKVTTFKNMGRAILFSGDLAAAKRVRRVASKARRSRGGR